MNPLDATAGLLLEVRQDLGSYERELDSLVLQNERLYVAATEDTLSGHPRRAIHASRRPLAAMARHTGIEVRVLTGFLKGEHGLPTEV